jgi:predicted transcriptional regulator
MTETRNGPAKELLVELTAEIVTAYVGKHVVPIPELAMLIADVHTALENTKVRFSEPAPAEKPKPAVPVHKSIQNSQITCLECGAGFKSLKRHLLSRHSLSADKYRDKWELPSDYSMVAPAYAKARSRLAREMGLGHRRDSSASA